MASRFTVHKTTVHKTTDFSSCSGVAFPPSPLFVLSLFSPSRLSVDGEVDLLEGRGAGGQEERQGEGGRGFH